VIYPNDHNPPHVHAISPNGEAKIDLEKFQCFFSRGFSERDIRLIVIQIKKEKEKFMEVWNEYHK